MTRWIPVLFLLLAVLAPQALGYAPESRFGGIVLPESSFDPVWNLADASGYSFCGGDPINRFDADGRVGKAVGDFVYQGGAAGYALREIASYLERYENTSAPAGWWTGLSSALAYQLAAASAPSTYVNGLCSYGHNVASYYQEFGLLPAASYALTSWNVGAIYSGLANFDLRYETAGQPIGDWYERGTVISGGVASTAGIAVEGLGIYNAAVVPVTGGTAPPVIQPVNTAARGTTIVGLTTYDVSFVSTGSKFLDAGGLRKAHVSNIQVTIDPGLHGADLASAIAHEGFHAAVAKNFPDFAVSAGRLPYIGAFPLYVEETAAYAYGAFKAGQYGQAIVAPVSAFRSMTPGQTLSVLGTGAAIGGLGYYTLSH